MASPQVEDGYVRIANELFDAILRFDFTKREQKIIFALIRKTYGYGKTEDDITVTQLAELTGIPRQHASAALSDLVAKRTVLKRDGRHGYLLKLNKNYKQWGCPETGHRPETGRGVSRNRTITVPKQDTQKTTPKDNPKRRAAAAATTSIWDVARGWCGGPLLGRLIRDQGEEVVKSGIVQTLEKIPADPKSYLLGCLKNGKSKQTSGRLSAVEATDEGIKRYLQRKGADT